MFRQCSDMFRDVHAPYEIPRVSVVQSTNFEVILRPTQAQQYVAERIQQPVSRTAFYNWRLHLGLTEAPYTLSDCEALAYFGHWVKSGATLATAKKQTIKYLQGEAS
jgi:hypothetical protein